ncbi:MAG: trigger factor [Eubacteriales bacterium]|nr:trigger factor [Eubacteriales bacterium]
MTQIKLGNYKGIEIPKIIVEVSEHEVASELERARQMAAEWTEVEKASDGDEVLIDFEGFLDGVPFNGGKGENYPLTLGSGSFIPGFEEQLIDAVKGDEIEVTVTFPEEYHAEELAGRKSVFKVKVHNVRRKQVPDIGDEFAAKISPYKTLDELKMKIEETVKAQKTAQKKQEAVKKQLLALCEVILDSEELERVVNEFVENTRAQLQSYGMTLENYLETIGSTVDDIKKENQVKAEEMLKATKILGEIAGLEGIQAAETEINREIEGLSSQYNIPLEQLKAMLSQEDKENIAADIKLGKAFQFVIDNSIEK